MTESTTELLPLTPDDDHSLIERLADRLTECWRAGARPLAEQFLTAHPELRGQPRAVLDLLAEELALREECGEPVSAETLVRRFPEFASEVRLLLECQRAIAPPATRHFPEAGERLGDFRLHSELGRGANGRVFLATQPTLANRPVVLKLAPATGGEYLALARLQHTHIVPLLSAHEFPTLGLRGLCLPYHGGATLADLLRTGQPLIVALRAAQALAPVALPVAGPAAEALAASDPVSAICGVIACLADALHYAHERGLLHLDVKPNNILVAADGVPMLLDFHLARQPLRPGDAAPAWFGGTPGYMPPEQSAAMTAIRQGRLVPQAVDARADLFALGIVMRDALRATERRVPTGLRDLVACCTNPDPSRRYASAAALASDLRRHLADLPLVGVRNRSLAERWRKWRRRRPTALPLVLAAGVLLAVGAAGVQYVRDVSTRAQTALEQGERHLTAGQYAAAAETLHGGSSLLTGLPFNRALAEQLRGRAAVAERARTASELHAVTERLRPLYAASLSPAALTVAAEQCQSLWAERTSFVQKLDPQPTLERERQWRADLLDLGILTAHLSARATGNAESALETLADAERLLGPSGVLELERATHARALGHVADADWAERQAATRPPHSAWEWLAVGRVRLGAGDLDAAGRASDECLRLDPQSFWGHYLTGTVAWKRGDPTRALAAFAAGVALAPESAWCRFNRGLAYAACGQNDAARADFAAAQALDPTIASPREPTE